MKLSFIGAGNMGGTLAISAAKKVNPKDIYLFDIDISKAKALAEKIGGTVADMDKSLQADYIFLGVKPQILPEVLKEISPKLSKGAVLVSMAAGVSTETISKYVGERPIIRIMPNTPAAFGEGMMLVCGKNVDEKKLCEFKNFMSESGKVLEIPEKLIDAGSAVSGCGPAFAYMFISALADGGTQCGLPYDMALTFAAQTVLGSAKTVLESSVQPEALKTAVCSPGGTTIEGVHALEKGAFRGTTMNAVKAAYEKTLKLAKK